MNPYGTHLPLLIKLVERTAGPVLELGMGENSTPVLHKLCTEQKRYLLSLDNDADYVDKFAQKYTSNIHQIQWVDDWDKAEIEKPWSVVLVDHRPARRRYRDASRVAEHAQFVVCHDTQEAHNGMYKWHRAFKFYKYRFDDTLDPRTTVLSNFHDLSFLKEGDT